MAEITVETSVEIPTNKENSKNLLLTSKYLTLDEGRIVVIRAVLFSLLLILTSIAFFGLNEL